MYILQYFIFFKQYFLEDTILYAVFVKYALINIRLPNQYTISIDLLSIYFLQFTLYFHQSNQHQGKQAKQA